MYSNNSRLDELAAQIGVIEQATAAALATMQTDLAELRGVLVSMSGDAPAPIYVNEGMGAGALALSDGFDASTGIDPAIVVTTDRATVIRVAHTFDNETTAQAPFTLGANTSGQWVAGLNADRLDGVHAAGFSNVAVTQATAGLTLNTGLQDVPGVSVTFTPAYSEKLLILALPVLNQYAGTAPSNNNDAITVEIQVNGVMLFQANLVADGGAGSRGMTRGATTTCNSGTIYTLKMQAKNGSGVRGQIGAASQMIVWRLPA